MEKGRESGLEDYIRLLILRSVTKLLLLVDSIAEFNFRGLTQVAHQRFESNLSIVLRDA